MLHNRRLFIFFVIGLTLFGLSQVLAQDVTPTVDNPTETAIPTLPPPTETATNLPTETPLPTLTPTLLPSPSETSTLFPTPTASDTATEPAVLTATETPTEELSESPIATLTEGVTLTPSPSLTVTLTPSLIPTDAAIQPQEGKTLVPPLPLLLVDDFSRVNGKAWSSNLSRLMTGDGDQATLHFTPQVQEPLRYNTGNIGDVNVQAKFLIKSGIASIVLRRSGAGNYSLALGANGEVTLYRDKNTLGNFAFKSDGNWHSFSISIIGTTISLDIDGSEVAKINDLSPLPSGMVYIEPFRQTPSDFFMDDFNLSGTLENPPAPKTALLPLNSLTAMRRLDLETVSLIAYSGDSDGNSDIWIMDSEGYHAGNLTSSAAYEYYPAWSSDGEKIAYTSDVNGNYDIFVMDLDGSNSQQITSSTTSDTQPTWSPDDSKIAFTQDNQICVVTLSNLSVSCLTSSGTEDAYNPAWSPDGNTILYEGYRNVSGTKIQIQKMSSAGVYQSKLTSESGGYFAYNPDWSPDGTKFAYNVSNGFGSGGLRVMTLSTSSIQNLTANPSSVNPTWSEDGNEIAYYSYINSSYHILKIAASGSPSTPIDLSDLAGYGGYNSIDPDWSLINQPVTPTPIPSATPTYTPTYGPSTSLDFNGTNAGLKAVMFWIIFRESNRDAVDSGNFVDNDLGSPRLSSFLFDYPYCSTGTGINDNGVETPNPSKNWYIRHCPGDYRYMAAQTMINGFLNYERRFGINYVFQYAIANFGGTINDTTNGMWSLDPNCITTIGSDYDTEYNNSSSLNSYAPVINWLTSYMNCIGASTSTNYRVVRAKRAYDTTILPEIVSAVSDFYTNPQDYTNAAFQAKALNFASNQIVVSCVGGCYINGNTGTVVYKYLSSQDTFTAFATALGSITQTDVDNAYATHITQISTYSGDFDSVGQPVLIESYDESTGNREGYTWETEIYQQAGDMSHSPR